MTIDGMKCPSCGQIAKMTTLEFEGFQIKGWRCPCGEEFYDPEESQRILRLNKVLGSTRMLKLEEDGGDLTLRLPRDVCEALGLKAGGQIRLDVENEHKISLNAA